MTSNAIVLALAALTGGFVAPYTTRAAANETVVVYRCRSLEGKYRANILTGGSSAAPRAQLFKGTSLMPFLDHPVTHNPGFEESFTGDAGFRLTLNTGIVSTSKQGRLQARIPQLEENVDVKVICQDDSGSASQAWAHGPTVRITNVFSSSGQAVITNPSTGREDQFSCTGGWQAENTFSANCGDLNDSASGGLFTILTPRDEKYSGVGQLRFPGESRITTLSCTSSNPNVAITCE